MKESSFWDRVDREKFDKIFGGYRIIVVQKYGYVYKVDEVRYKVFELRRSDVKYRK